MSDRLKRIKRIYGLEPEEYQQLLDEYNGKCWICGKSPKEGGRSLHIEHSHQTLAIRGITCWGCNKGLKAFRDSPDFLRRAADYLEHNTGFRAPETPKRRGKRRNINKKKDKKKASQSGKDKGQ